MQNKDPRWPQGNSQYDTQSQRRGQHGEHISDRYRSDHDLNLSRARYDNDQDYSRDFMNRDNRNYDSRSYEGGNYENSAYQTPSYMGERWGQPTYSSRDRNRGQSGLYGGRRNEESHTVMDDIKSFFGIGPKNYRRSDDRIREDICEVFTCDHDLDATHLDVTVKDAVVTLTGTVPQRSAKRLAEDLAEAVRGVSDVRNEIQVKNIMTDDLSSSGSSPRKNSDHLI